MRTSLEYVKLARHAVAKQRGGELQAVFRSYAFVFRGMPKKGGRRSCVHVRLARKELDKRRNGIVAQKRVAAADMRELSLKSDDWITKNQHVRAAALPLQRIGRLRIAEIEMRSRRRGQMAACRKTENADSVRIDVPFRRA